MKNVLITGATGFIGSHLVARVAERGDRVRILALPGDDGAKLYEKAGCEVIYGDISDLEAVSEALSGIQIVYHLAAVVSDWAPARLYRKVNIEGTENICRVSLANRIERLIYMSTNDVFGRREDTLINESFPYSSWKEPYPDSKLEASNIVWKYYRSGLPVTIIYPCWVYGPGDTTFLLPLIKAIKLKQLVFWRENALIWPAYVDNVIDLLIEVADNSKAIGEGFLVHDGVFDTFQNFAIRVSRDLGLARPRLRIPYFAAYAVAITMQNIWQTLGLQNRPLLTTYIVKNLGSRWRFSISKARDLLNWQPPVSYHQGLTITLQWARSELDSQTSRLT